MQRQSLGSPGRTSPYPPPGGDTDDSKRRESTSSSSSSSPPLITSFSDEVKPEKPLKCRHHYNYSPEKFIHFIPVLLIVCFFVLYLLSHDPSPSDLAQFNGFFKHHPEKIIDIDDEIGRINGENKSLKRSGAFAIRNLQEEIQGDNNNNNITTQKSRKLGDF